MTRKFPSRPLPARHKPGKERRSPQPTINRILTFPPILHLYAYEPPSASTMATFSWSDTFKAAFSSCLPCLSSWSASNPAPDDSNNDVLIHTNEGGHRIARARPDELQGLLADVTDTDTEAETHSLHSNIGAEARRRSRKSKRRTTPKLITFFGWNLFGQPAIQLPPDEDGAAADRGDSTPFRSSSSRRTRDRSGSGTISSSTLDADAAPLDPSVIEQLSPVQLQDRALAAAEEERRRQHRKERRELKRAARALAVGLTDEDTFEGFPGSGGGGAGAYPRMPSPFAKRPSAEPNVESFGPFVGADAKGRRQAEVDGDADDADLGGELYARHSATNSNSGSDSRGSSSNNPSQQPHHPTARHLPSLTPVSNGPRRTKKSRSSATSRSASQSPSLASPVLPPYTNPRVTLVTPTSPQQDGLDLGFPSTGFSGVRSKNRDLGAFLARRGDA